MPRSRLRAVLIGFGRIRGSRLPQIIARPGGNECARRPRAFPDRGTIGRVTMSCRDWAMIFGAVKSTGLSAQVALNA